MGNVADGITNLADANATFVSDAGKIFGQVDTNGLWEQMTNQVPTDGQSMELVLTDDLSTVNLWTAGESKRYQGSRAYKVRYEMETYDASKTLSRKEVDYDKSGSVSMQLTQFLERNRSFLNKVVMDKFLTQPVGYDGVALISASHPNGVAGATQSNLTASALSHTTYNAGIAAMQLLQKENEEYFDFRPTALVVPPGLERTAKEIAVSESRVFPFDNTGVEAAVAVVGAVTIPNVMSGLQVFVDKRMTAGDWIMLDLSAPGIRPWYASIPRGPEAITATDMDSSPRMDLDMYAWSIEADVIQGPGHWQCIYGKLT